MGADIAEVSAVAGMPVVVRDLPQFLDAAGAGGDGWRGQAGKDGQDKRDEVLARITFTPDLKDVERGHRDRGGPGDPRSEGVADQGTAGFIVNFLLIG